MTLLPLVPPPPIGAILRVVAGEVISFDGEGPYIEMNLERVTGCPFQDQLDGGK